MERKVTHQIKIGEKIYSPGLHDFSDETRAHEHYKFYVKAGRIHAPAAAPGSKAMANTEEAIEQRKAMEEKWGVKQAAPPVGPVAPVEPEPEVEAQTPIKKSKR